MLENEQGVPLPPVYWPNPPRHWQILPLLLREHALVNPLRVAIHQYIDTAVANLGRGQQLIVNSTIDGHQILGNVASWAHDYGQWQTALGQRFPQLPAVAADEAFGLLLWYVFAGERVTERWRVSSHQNQRLYELQP